MTPLREAAVLPALFLTVVLVSALRPGAAVVVAPPSLESLVAGMAVLALLVRSGVLAPERLMHAQRSMLANLNGLSVLLTTFVASAQLITALVPESGAPALFGWIVFVSLLVQAFATTPDRTRLLRGLLVTFGAAFVVKFVVLASISAPAESRLARVVQVVFEGVTLGAVSQRPMHPAEGYLAFLAIALYLVAVALLPAADWRIVRVRNNALSAPPDVSLIE